jgi:hypothetical protein
MDERRGRRRSRRDDARTFEILSVQGKDEDWISELREDVDGPDPGPDDGEWVDVRKALDAHQSALADLAERLDAVEAALGELATPAQPEGPPPAGPDVPAPPTVRSVVHALRASASGSAARLAREAREARRRIR